MNINDTIIHYIHIMNPSIEQRLISNIRLDICKICPHKLEKNTISQYDNKEYMIWTCDACGCPLIPKSHKQKKGLCPLGKWNDIENQML